MFRVTNLTAKNFLSIGNITQAVNFDRQDLTLVLGSNLDLGGDDTGSRNGTGKTTDRKSTRLNSSHSQQSRMPSSA